MRVKFFIEPNAYACNWYGRDSFSEHVHALADNKRTTVIQYYDFYTRLFAYT